MADHNPADATVTKSTIGLDAGTQTETSPKCPKETRETKTSVGTLGRELVNSSQVWPIPWVTD